MTTALVAALLVLLFAAVPGCAAPSSGGSAPHDHQSRASNSPGATENLALTQGRVRLLHDGKPIPAAAYCDYITDPALEQWKIRINEFARNGVKTYCINVAHQPSDYFDSTYWTDDGVYPDAEPDSPRSLANQARAILAVEPDALFFVRTWVSPPLAWTKKNPGDVQTDEDGKLHRHASLASDKYIDGISRGLRALVTYCESQPWGSHVVGYLPAPLGEGCLPLVIEGKMFDCSAASEAGFREYLERTYKTDDALREAWRDANVTLASARVPRDRDWLEKRRTAAPTYGGKPINPTTMPSNSHVPPTGLFHWIEPVNAMPEIDYCKFEREMFLRWIRAMAHALKGRAKELGLSRIVGFDIGKQPLMGWQIQLAFDGQGDGQSYQHLLPLSGSFNLGELFDDPEIDCLFTPADYHARTVGYAYEPEGPADTMVLRKKTLIVENDARSWVGGGAKDQGAWRDPAEAEAGLLRNEALSLSRGFHSYWCNVGSSYFHDDRLQEIVGRMTPMIEATHRRPHRETADAIAMIIDDQSPLFEDFTSGFQSLAVIWQRIKGLAHCGVPYRIYLLSDLEKEDFPRCKVFLFPNLFKVDDHVMAVLRKKVLRDGNVAIFGPATGITDGKFLTAEPASKLLGVSMELIPRTTMRQVILQETRPTPAKDPAAKPLAPRNPGDPFPGVIGSHPILREVGAGTTFGDSLPYGPTLVPAERAVEAAGGTVLGHANLCWFIHRAGLFVKEFGQGAAGNGKPGARGGDDYAVLWSCAAPLPEDLLRAASRYAGCNIWCDQPDVIYASDSFVSIHSVRSGPRTIHLPRPMNVTDAMTGKPIGKGLREIKLTLAAPETRVFWLD
ncbi:MAG: hypothetical protein NTW19_03365 [Planctomycetota bacterium]|nr:hypothetical protein [Planctomycetota bacterium]